MSKPKSQEFFLGQLKEIYKDKYDFSITKYINAGTNVLFKCPIHGVQETRPDRLLGGFGCPQCGYDERAKRQKGRKGKYREVYGVGICDAITVDENSRTLKSYFAWSNILLRCYSDAYHRHQPTYVGCEICEEWKRYSVFKKWFNENAREGFQLDKDLVSPQERIYSPQTCSFVPTLINHIISRCGENDRGRGKYLIGVHPDRRRFVATLTKYGKSITVGRYDTEVEAFNAYKTAKEAYVKEVAQEYYDRGDITEKVYNALMNYKVEIKD